MGSLLQTGLSEFQQREAGSERSMAWNKAGHGVRKGIFSQDVKPGPRKKK